ncbi:MAG: hypothetical protein QGH70_08775, partial [Nitrospinota bacterium]|nr:hypothetical protein [Nitrospinota bacterium]
CPAWVVLACDRWHGAEVGDQLVNEDHAGPRQVEEAAEDLGVPLEEHLQIVLDVMKENAESLGLAG